MKQGLLTYKYIKQLTGRGRYGAVTIRIIPTINGANVKDCCEWKVFRKAYPNFVELNILKLWKQSAINAATEVINSFSLPGDIEVIVQDIMGLYVDTCPSHVGAAMIIGIFDYCELPLNHENLQLLDEFVEKNSEMDCIPDYKHLHFSIDKRI